MDLRETIAFVEEFEKELTLFNLDPSDPIARELESFFDTQNVRITTDRTASGTPEDVAVLSSSDEVLAVVGVERLRDLLTRSQRGRVGVADATHEAVLVHLKETTFTSYDTEEMLYASREIEDRARRNGTGTVHAGFQRCSVMADQRAVYADLAERGLTVHAYGVPDTALPDIGDGQVHARRTDEVADTWFVVFNGGDEPTHRSALLAEERAENRFYGVWTYDGGIVESVCDHLERTYLSANRPDRRSESRR